MAKRSIVIIWPVDGEPEKYDCCYYDCRTSPGCIILMLNENGSKPERRKMIPYQRIRDIDVLTYDSKDGPPDA